MAKPKRLSPQPTNTRLARFVGRMVRRWPLAFASTVRAKEHRIAYLNDQLRMTWERQDAIQRDMMEIMDRIKPPMPPFDVRMEDNLADHSTRVRIDFHSVAMAMPSPLKRRALSLSRHTEELSAQCAKELAHHHAREFAARIAENLDRIIKAANAR